MNKIFRFRILMVMGLLSAVTGMVGAVDAGQAIWAARDQVIDQLVSGLPAEIPEGPVAVLPPEVVGAEVVDTGASTTWVTAVSEAIHRLRPEVELADRESLTAILREQKFGDSAYADPTTAVEVGKLVSARTLLMTRLHEFRLKGGRVRVRLEATLVDVETGRNLWSKAVTQGIFPWWAKVGLLAIALALGFLAWRGWLKRRKTVLVKQELPRAKAEVRVDVDGLARAAVDARDRLKHAGADEAAAEVHRAWVDLDAALDRVRHALPGGAVDRSRVRDLKGALAEAGELAGLLEDLRSECDSMEVGAAGGRALARRLGAAVAEVRAAVDGFRRHMV